HAAVAADLDRGCGQRGDATAVADEAAAAGSGSCATGDVRADRTACDTGTRAAMVTGTLAHAARTAGGYGDSRGSGRTRERDGQIGAGCCLADAAAIAAIAGGCRVAAVAARRLSVNGRLRPAPLVTLLVGCRACGTAVAAAGGAIPTRAAPGVGCGVIRVTADRLGIGDGVAADTADRLGDGIDLALAVGGLAHAERVAAGDRVDCCIAAGAAIAAGSAGGQVGWRGPAGAAIAAGCGGDAGCRVSSRVDHIQDGDGVAACAAGAADPARRRSPTDTAVSARRLHRVERPVGLHKGIAVKDRLAGPAIRSRGGRRGAGRSVHAVGTDNGNVGSEGRRRRDKGCRENDCQPCGQVLPADSLATGGTLPVSVSACRLGGSFHVSGLAASFNTAGLSVSGTLP